MPGEGTGAGGSRCLLTVSGDRAKGFYGLSAGVDATNARGGSREQLVPGDLWPSFFMKYRRVFVKGLCCYITLARYETPPAVGLTEQLHGGVIFHHHFLEGRYLFCRGARKLFGLERKEAYKLDTVFIFLV